MQTRPIVKPLGQVALIAGALVLLFLSLAEKLYQVDDTFITLQYARNLVETGSLTWHPDLPMVDGFTSLGHTLLLALGGWAGLDLVGWASIVSLLSAVGLVVLCQRQMSGQTWMAQAVGLTFLALNTGLQFWTNAGLDAVLYALVFFSTYLAFSSDLREGHLRLHTVGVLAVLGMVRPEGMLIAPALLAYFLLTQARAPGFVARRFWIGSALVLAAIAAQIVWRIQVYGHPVPNTFYAKASAERLREMEFGALYLLSWLVHSYGALALVVSGLSLWITREPLRLLFILGQLLLVVVAGGDSHPAERFFLPILPLLALDFAVTAERLRRPLLILGLMVLAVWSTRQSSASLGHWSFPDPRQSYANLSQGAWPIGVFTPAMQRVVWGPASTQLGRRLPEGTLVAATDVGALALYSRLPVLDAFGLNHATIGALPKPKGVTNVWGIYRLDVVLKDSPPVIYLDLPQYYRWSFDDITSGRSDCLGRGKDRILDLIYAYEGPLQQGYLCVSAPADQRADQRLNLLISKARPDLSEGFGPGTQVSDCVAALMQACQATVSDVYRPTDRLAD